MDPFYAWRTKPEPVTAPALGCGLNLTEILVLAAGERQAGENLGPFLLNGLQGAGIESEGLQDGEIGATGWAERSGSCRAGEWPDCRCCV